MVAIHARQLIFVLYVRTQLLFQIKMDNVSALSFSKSSILMENVNHALSQAVILVKLGKILLVFIALTRKQWLIQQENANVLKEVI